MENQTKQKLNRQNSGIDTKLPIKIVQFGGGNFMRGFTDYVIDKVAEKFSKSFVIGAKAHVKIDENEDHYEMMLDVAHRLIVKYADEEILIDILRKIAEFIAAYFYELYQETVITS